MIFGFEHVDHRLLLVQPLHKFLLGVHDQHRRHDQGYEKSGEGRDGTAACEVQLDWRWQAVKSLPKPEYATSFHSINFYFFISMNSNGYKISKSLALNELVRRLFQLIDARFVF